ncbi:MAG: ATP-binding protein [Actinobacteria bacterium]|nr:ATP-binding protein [Actinomycetota bacterium]
MLFRRSLIDTCSVLSRGELEAVLEGGHELQSFEVKGAGPATDSHLLAKVAKGAMGLGNLQDGGHIIIGIEDKKLRDMTPGLDPTDLATWMDSDSVSARMAVYSAPPIKFHVEPVTLKNGTTVAVMEVAEFSDSPHICIKQLDGVMLCGRVYIRTRSKPETAPIESANDMRELLDLATDKRLRALVKRLSRAGVPLTPTDPELSDAQKFEDEKRRGWSD